MDEPELTAVAGIRADDEFPDPDEVYERACEEWRRSEEAQARRERQKLVFDHGPVGLAFVGDQHLGGRGVNVPRCFAEAELIARTPGLWAVVLGDVIDNFIWSSLLSVRLETTMSIPEEWALVRRYLGVLGPRLVLSVGGNHDQWTTRLAGVDYFREAVAEVNPDCIYDRDDARVEVRVGEIPFYGRIRHRWKGSSIYNPTHGIERAAKWDQDFQWGVGAHTHQAGVVRSFNNGGIGGMAAQVGSYKVVDPYARRLGFPKSNQSTAVVIVFDDETRSMTGFDNLHVAARFMRRLYREVGT
jgi:hypothetical protein